MQQTSLFFEGINLMILGMGFVFVFLVFLIFAMRLMSKIVIRFTPAPIPSNRKSKSKRAVKVTPPEQDERLLKVLSAAVQHHQMQQQTNS